MLIIPAIDLKDGCVVRFVQGRLDKKVYSSDPVKTAKHWVRQGAKLLHIIDLDGATTGIPKNISFVKEIVKEVDVPVEFGGGVREIKTVKELFECGIYRLVLGTKAIEDGAFLKKMFAEYKERIIVSLDAKGLNLSTKGWRENSKNDAFDFAMSLKSMGVRQIIYTDIMKDGTLKGPNLKVLKKLLKETGLQIIASGGVSSLDDLYKLKPLEKQGLIGVIIGKALYEGRFILSEAIKMAGG